MKLQDKAFIFPPLRLILAAVSLLGMAMLSPVTATAAITVTPSTWNIIGLDSNTPASGPNRFPVGAQVCSTTAVTDIPVSFNWDAGGTDNGTYIYLRPGSNSSLTIPSIAAGTCADAFFEVEVNRSLSAFDQTRRYYITAGGVSTPRPRELKVERLVSQGRNAITNMEFGTSLAAMTSVANGGSMDLTIGNTYYIRMTGYTATQGYEQLESFVNFPNTIFQILSVSSTYSADTSPIVDSPSDKLYADACGWDNDPASPSYLSCWVDGKAGGSVTVTYQVKILNAGTSRETLGSLIHDFSGSSFHYNSDFSTSARFANIVDPTAVTITKNFAPDPNNVGGVSSLTFTLRNPNSGALSDVSFTDTFPNLLSMPAAPGNMSLANTTTTNTCGGTLSDDGGDSLAAGDGGIRLAGATIPANGSCSVVVNVTTSSTGTYTNTSGHVFVGTTDTGKYATDTLTVNTDPPPGAGVCGAVMASWSFPTGFTPASPTPSVNNITTATATPGAGLNAVASTTNHSGLSSSSWSSNGGVATGATLATANNDYFQFALNTTGYTKIYPTFWAQRTNSGPQGLAVYYGNSAGEPEGGTQLSSSTLTSTALTAKDTWYQFGASPNLLEIPVTSNTTYIRIYFYNAGNSNPSSDVFIDDVSFDGCKLPTMPTIAKAFSPATIAGGGTSTLTFTLTNPNTTPLTGATFTDPLPAGMSVANPPNANSSNCGAPTWAPANGATTLSFSGGTLPASGNPQCTVWVDVQAPTGVYSNTSGFLSTTEGGQNKNSIATATLTALAPPNIAKAFAPDPILEGGVTTLTFRITNPNANDALSLVAFTDTLPVAPGAMVVAPAPNASTSIECGTPTFAPAAGAGAIAFSGGTIAAAATCTVTVDVTAPAAGTYTNTSSTVSHQLPAGTTWTGNIATATLQVEKANPAVALLKQVASTGTGPWASYLAVAAGDNVYYKFTVENLGDVPLNPFSVTDPGLPAPLSLDNCTWRNGDGTVLTAPLTLPVADADNGHLATCILGPAVSATGSHPNTATASGTYNTTTVTDTSTATYATSALTLAKSATEAYFLAAGDVLNYSYTVSNTGAAILTGPLTIAVSDNKISTVTCPAIATVGDNDIDFDPGETLTCTAAYTVTASDVTAGQVVNVARANVSGVNIGSLFTPTATETVPLGPDLSVTKANNIGGNAATNTPFTWALTVNNAVSAGSAAAFVNGQTLLRDDLPAAGATYSAPAVATNAGGTSGTISCAITANVLICTATGTVSIPPSGSFSIAVTTTPTAAGSLANPNGAGICQVDPGRVLTETDEDNNDCANIVTVTTPSVTLLKTANKSYFLVEGEVINYTYKVSNTGATALAGPVTVADDKTTDESCPAVTTIGDNDTDLDPGEELTCTSSYAVLAADVTARQVTNTATATVANAGLPVSSPQVSLTVPIGPDLSVVKTHPASTPIPGVPFNWTLTVTNATTAGYAATFSDTQLLLTDDLPSSGATYSVLATATNTGGTTGTINCSVAANTLTCTASGAVSVPPGSGFTVAVAVTAASGGTLTNPRSGGNCRVDPSTLVAEISDTNNDCADSVLVGMPNITFLKMVQPYWDPLNGYTNPKAIPGALVVYTLMMTNTGYGPTDAGSVVIVDPLPANIEMFVSDINGAGSGPVRFIDGTTASGLSYNFVSLANATDKLAFSNNGGANYTYTPTPDAVTNCDPAVTNIKVSFDNKTVLPYDIFAGSNGTNHPSFTLLFRARIK